MYWLDNSVTFSKKPMGSEEFFNQMVEILGIIIDRLPKERLRKGESKTIEKIGCPIFVYRKIWGQALLFVLH
jgi:hypothetical protein